MDAKRVAKSKLKLVFELFNSIVHILLKRYRIYFLAPQKLARIFDGMPKVYCSSSSSQRRDFGCTDWGNGITSSKSLCMWICVWLEEAASQSLCLINSSNPEVAILWQTLIHSLQSLRKRSLGATNRIRNQKEIILSPNHTQHRQLFRLCIIVFTRKFSVRDKNIHRMWKES